MIGLNGRCVSCGRDFYDEHLPGAECPSEDCQSHESVVVVTRYGQTDSGQTMLVGSMGRLHEVTAMLPDSAVYVQAAYSRREWVCGAQVPNSQFAAFIDPWSAGIPTSRLPLAYRELQTPFLIRVRTTSKVLYFPVVAFCRDDATANECIEREEGASLIGIDSLGFRIVAANEPVYTALRQVA